MASPDMQSDHPSQQQMMQQPQAMVITGIPPGLEYLAYLDTLYVHQEIELLEIFTGFECANRYSVMNSVGQRIYFAAEQSDCCARACMVERRPFEIKVLDPAGTSVINIVRPCTCGLYYCSSCYGNKVDVHAGLNNEYLGAVEVVYQCCQPTFNLLNANGEIVFLCQTTKCGMCCPCGTVPFDLLTPGGTVVGSVTKFFSGIIQEMYTNADNFGAQFPIDLDPRMKAVILGCIFLIDFTYFERRHSRRNRLLE